MRPYEQSAASSRCHRSWRNARLQGRSGLVSGADAKRRPDPELTICKFFGRSHQRSANSLEGFARSFGNSPTRLASHNPNANLGVLHCSLQRADNKYYVRLNRDYCIRCTITPPRATATRHPATCSRQVPVTCGNTRDWPIGPAGKSTKAALRSWRPSSWDVPPIRGFARILH